MKLRYLLLKSRESIGGDDMVLPVDSFLTVME